MPRVTHPTKRKQVPRTLKRVTYGGGAGPLQTLDGRSVWARMFKRVYTELANHVGGEHELTLPWQSTIRRIACLETELAYLETRIGEARQVGKVPELQDIDLYARLSNTQDRLLARIGWKRMPVDVTPNIREFLQQMEDEPA